MISRLSLAAILLVGACAGGPMYASLGATPDGAPSAVFDCARAQFKPLGFEQASYDVNDLRLTARRIDSGVTRPDRTFRRQIDRIFIEIHPGADGRTAMKIEAHTFGEYQTIRGPTEIEEPATERVKTAAATIVQNCGQ